MFVKKALLGIAATGIFWVGCGNKPANTPPQDASVNVTANNRTVENHQSLADAQVKFEFQENSEVDPPTTKVFANINGKKIEVANTTGIANEMGISERNNYQVPETAVAACQSWWAGGGDVFFIENAGDAIIVKSFVIGEELDPNAKPDIQEVKRLTANDLK